MSNITSPRLADRRRAQATPAAAPAPVEPVITDDTAPPPSEVEHRAPLRSDAHQPAHTPAREAAHEPMRRTRRRKLSNTDNPFDLPLDEIPEGSVYEWKRYSNVGEENPFYIASMRDQGWEPVDPKRHPNWLPPGYSQPNIIKGGLLLMERPKELQEEARREERMTAKRQVVEAEQRLGMTPRGELSRSADARVAPVVQKDMMRPVIVAEDE